jgi:3-hydroxyacyl-CoA dehydrogenase
MTATLGGGGNPGGFRRVADHLGPGLWTYARDMQEHSALDKDPHEALRSVVSIVEERMGKVGTMALERERDELPGKIIRLRKEKTTLM